MKFFFDNCLATRHATALDALLQPEHSVTHLRTLFPADTPDVKWIEALGRQGNWVIISGDVRIMRNAHERDAWHQSGLTVFFLAKAWMSIPLLDQHAKLAQRFTDIIAHAENARPGSGFIVQIGSKIERIYP